MCQLSSSINFNSGEIERSIAYDVYGSFIESTRLRGQVYQSNGLLFDCFIVNTWDTTKSFTLLYKIAGNNSTQSTKPPWIAGNLITTILKSMRLLIIITRKCVNSCYIVILHSFYSNMSSCCISHAKIMYIIIIHL